MHRRLGSAPRPAASEHERSGDLVTRRSEQNVKILSEPLIQRAFWWPFTGFSLNEVPLPVTERPVLLLLVMELLGLVLMLWNWHLMGLNQPDRRQLFLRSGRLDPALTSPRVRK